MPEYKDKIKESFSKISYKRNLFRIIEGFINVVREGSFIKASKLMNVSNSTTSTQISVLEKNLGVTLLVRERGSKSIKLTEEGKKFYKAVSAIMDGLQDVMLEFNKDITESKKRIKIACYPLFNDIAIKVLSKMQIPFIIENRPTGDALSAVEEDEVDLAIYPKKIKDLYGRDLLNSETILRYNAMIFSHKDNPILKKTASEIKASDIKNRVSFGRYFISEEADSGSNETRSSFFNDIESVKNHLIKNKSMCVLDQRWAPYMLHESIESRDVSDLCKDIFFLFIEKKERRKNQFIEQFKRDVAEELKALKVFPE